ncbi:hypothetical protein [uncultured Leuconostoc sp.]|uniref:hypothetical protein n=1 Tax=uncultured Leuconostoc sp. TaxID=173262 RepID=UPI00259AA822|nr:hypothetical protein [uncultured Leuconostoc sp.]
MEEVSFLGLAVGSWAEWFGAIGTLGAVVFAVWQTTFGIKRERRIVEKNDYSQKIFENVVGIENDVQDLKEWFITRNHPIALDDAITSGSKVDLMVLSSTGLQTDISKRLNSLKNHINVSRINQYINLNQAKIVDDQVETTIWNIVDLFRSVCETGNILEANRSQLDTAAPDLTQYEKKIFDETVELFDLTDSNLKELQKCLVNIFG